QVLMNIINKGKIAVRDIQITDLDEDTVVAKEDTTSALPTHSPFIRTEGRLFIGKSTFGDGYSAFTNGYAIIRSNPELFELSENTIYIFEFDWKMLQNKQQLEHVGYTRIYSPIKSTEDLGGIHLPGYGIDGGHFVGGFRTGPEDVPYILELAVFDDVIMEIANLKVSVQKPVEQSVDEHPAQHLADTPFPRLGNIQTQFFEWVAHNGSGTAQGDLPLTNIVDLERDIAVSDVVVGMHPVFSSNDPGASLRLRNLNPGIVLLPMVPTHRIGIDSWMVDQMMNSMVSAEVAFIQGIGEDWYLRDPKGNVLSEGEGYQSILLNVSPFCPYDANGRKYLDYWADTVVDLHVLDGSWDGVYLDQLLTKTHYGIKGAYAATKVNADYNRNLKKDETLVWTHEMTAAASLTMLRNLRERFGDAELILTTPHFDYLLAPLSNGVAVSNFNLAWYMQNDPEWFSEAQWCWNVFNYWQIMDSYRDPSVIVLEATPMHPNWIPPENKREPDELDLRFQRFAIGTALLTDGFYEYDLVDARSAPYFFDEMLVDSSGASTTSVEGKGWLGKALGPAEEIVGGSETVVSKPDPMLLGNKGSKSKILYRGRNTDDESRQFVLEFDWQLLETASNVPVVNVSIDNEWRDYFDLPGLLKGASGHVRFHTTVEPKEELLWKLDIGKKGVVEIKNLRVAKTDAGIFRRDFEHGLVLVNATAVEKEISLGDIRGALGRAGIRRIRGSLDVVTNNGRPVEGALTLPAHDAIVLVVN
ncbi:MAG: putative glycoside hydrolase, partial [Sphaerochaetaceae bacterium]